MQPRVVRRGVFELLYPELIVVRDNGLLSDVAAFLVICGPGNRQPQRPVTVGIKPGEAALDVDGVGAVKQHVLMVGGPDVRQGLVIDVPAGGAQGGQARPRYSLIQHTIALVARVRHHICSVCCPGYRRRRAPWWA